jgi:protease I
MLAADGVERAHVEGLRRAHENAGLRVELIGPRRGEIWAMDHLDKAATFPVDLPPRDARADDYGCLVIPGGVAGVDHLRRDPAAIALVSDFVAAERPVAAVAHAPWLLVEADLVRGRTLTSWPSIRTDVVNGGATWVDTDVCVDGALPSCARSENLPELSRALIEALG